MSMELDLACEDDLGPREPRLEAGSVVITGGTALALWIRYLRKEKNVEPTEELKLAETVADWDFHPTRTTDPGFFFGDRSCSLRVDERTNEKGFVQGEHKFQLNHVHIDGVAETYEYDVNRVVLRDIVAELFPNECTTDPNEGCALVDYGLATPHENDFEGPIIKKLRIHEKRKPENLTFPLPSSIVNSTARPPARDVVSLLHPEVTIVAHLQALSIDNLSTVTRQKTKRRAARIKCFHELYDSVWEGFKIEGHDVTVRGNVIDAMRKFLETEFCNIVLSDDEEAIEKLYTDTENVLKKFNGKTSFAPYGLRR